MVVVGLAPLASATADPHKVLRIASPNIETLDPQRYNDDPSYQVQFAIFEGLYEWNHLDPSRLSPNTATAMPIVTDNGRTWTLHVKHGIYFTPDAAFKGKRRELVAEDYVYTFKRVLDPALRGGAPVTADLIVGARPVVDAARKPGGKFDYDRPIRGLRSLDKYTLALELEAPTIQSSTISSPTAQSRARSSKRRATTPARAPSGPGRFGSGNGIRARG